MSISFELIPSTNRVPGAYVEVDGSRAVSSQPGTPQRVLLIGLALASGTATPNQIVEVQGELGGDGPFGTASQLSAMARAFRRVNRNARLFCLPIAENGAGVAATSTIALSGTASALGVLTSRIGDLRISTPAELGKTAADLATAHAASINATPRSPVTAAAVAGTITLTYRHKGEPGNDVTIETEQKPAGITAVDTQPVNGATNPSIAAAIANMDDSRYDTVASGIADATNVGLLEAELDRRWGPMVKQPGHLIVARRGTYASLVTYGNARNSARSTVVGSGLSPTPPSIWAAQVAARDAERCATQPNRPREGLTLPDCEAPKLGDRFDGYERDALLHDGISTYKVGPDGRVMIERLITTYQVNAQGAADVTYLSIETVRNLADFYLDFLSLKDQHQSDLLAPDGTNSDPGVPVVTPKMMRGEFIAKYRARERRGLCTDTEGFSESLVLLINEQDHERLDVHCLPRFVNGFVTLAVKVSFQI
jgi:phage tail sheath gpL-like